MFVKINDAAQTSDLVLLQSGLKKQFSSRGLSMVALESTEQKVTLVQWFSIMFCPASPWRQKCFHNCFSNAVKKIGLKKY